MDGSVVATLAGMGLGLVFCTATCIICRIWRRNRYYKKVQHSLDEEERALETQRWADVISASEVKPPL